MAASAAQIRRAYQRLARRYSPDVNLWDREADGLFEEISSGLSRPQRSLGANALRPSGDGGRSGRRTAADRRRACRRRGDDIHVPVELAFDQAAAGLTADLAVERLSRLRDLRGHGRAARRRPGAVRALRRHGRGLGQ